MGFFKDLSQDVSQAIGELIPEQLIEDDVMVDTLGDGVNQDAQKEVTEDAKPAKKEKVKKTKKKAKEETAQGGNNVIADLVAQEEEATREVNEQLQKEIMSYLENGGLDNVVIDEDMITEDSVDDVMVDTLTDMAFDEVITDELAAEVVAENTSQTLDEIEETPAVQEDDNMDINEKEEIENIIESLGELAPEEMGVVFDEEEQAEKTIEEKLLDDDFDVTPLTPSKTASQEVSIITKGTSVDGSIKASGALEIYGKVSGDVECLGKLTILGDVTGNAKANEIYINTSRFEGDVNSAGAVKIGVGTVVIGDVTGTGAVIAGAVKGEVDISGPVILDSTAVVKGNIKAKSVQINNGAVLQGFCSLAYSSVDIDDFFDTEEFR